MILKLTNNLDKREYEYEVNDFGDSRSFYHFAMTLDSGMPDGEYTYRLLNDDELEVATGLLQVGDYTNNARTYTTNSSRYKQYSP